VKSEPVTTALGLDFGTTNTVVARTDGTGRSRLIEFEGAEATGAIFRSALCFWEEEGGWNGIANEAGPWAIAEYLQSPSRADSIKEKRVRFRLTAPAARVATFYCGIAR
jgi:hypothetical chaperone protein